VASLILPPEKKTCTSRAAGRGEDGSRRRWNTALQNKGMERMKRDEVMNTYVDQVSGFRFQVSDSRLQIPGYCYALISIDVEINQSGSISYNPRRYTRLITLTILRGSI
jgi:hypothetical protein